MVSFPCVLQSTIDPTHDRSLEPDALTASSGSGRDTPHLITAIATAWLSGDRYLDTPKLLEHGAYPISIAIYCLLTIGFGYVGFRRQCVRMLAPTHVGTTTGSAQK